MIRFTMRVELANRHKQILEILSQEAGISPSTVFERLTKAGYDISRPTLNRDLETLVEIGFISQSGKGPATSYSITLKAKLETQIDVGGYFQKSPDERDANKSFNWQIFDQLSSYQVFNKEELDLLDGLSNIYQQNIKKLSETIIKKEIERITIEFSWKSSKIEGNTYTLLETENLIKNGVEASGHTKEESTMILNHKKALDFVYSNSGNFHELNKKKIEDIHTILTKNLNIDSGIRSLPVAITGTVYRPLDNQAQLIEALDKSLELINSQKTNYAKSLLTMLLMSYLQLFEDGNKRTSRLLGNALLLNGKLCPLSLRSVDEEKYKQGLILFYEQNNILLFKQIYLEQAKFAVENYFVA